MAVESKHRWLCVVWLLLWAVAAALLLSYLVDYNAQYLALDDFRITRHWLTGGQPVCQYGRFDPVVVCWNGWIGGEYTFRNRTVTCELNVVSNDPRTASEIMGQLKRDYPDGPFRVWSKLPEVSNKCEMAPLSNITIPSVAVGGLGVFALAAFVWAVVCQCRQAIVPNPPDPQSSEPEVDASNFYRPL